MNKPLNGQQAVFAALAALTMLVGCAQRPASLDTAQAAIQSARADADVSTYAAAELDAAQTQLASANQAWEDGDGRDEAAHRAALATQQVEIARARAEARKSEAQIANLGDQRDKVMRQSAEQQVRTLQQQLASLQARQTDRGIVLTVGDVLFDVGQATLKPGAVDEIVRLAVFLRENPDRAVRIEGHTDSTGSVETNMVLSQRRADAVADTLTAAGIPRSRVVAVGYGPDLPVATNATAAGRQQNRRVEVVIENARLTSQPMKPAATATQNSCFGLAMQFDHALAQKMMGADIESAKQIAGDATALRNQGLSACQAGDRQGGRRLLEAALAAL